MTTDLDTTIELDATPDLPGLHARRPSRTDAEYAEIAQLAHAVAAADDVPWRPTPAHIRDDFERRPGIDPSQDIVVVEHDGRIVAHAEVQRVVRGDVVVFHLSGSVHPEVRRHGLGRALLRENVRRATERAMAETGDRPIELGAFAELQETGHRTLLESEGFETIRWFFLMRRDLDLPIPDAPLPDGLELRPLQPEQHRAVWEAEVEAFRDHFGAREKLEEDFARTYSQDEFDPALWVVAWDGDQVAGVVQNWIWTAENASLGVARGWLEHISVRRPWRRRGLARAITATSLRRLRDAGMDDAMLGVDSQNANGALGLYEGLGFAIHSRSSAYRRPFPRS